MGEQTCPDCGAPIPAEAGQHALTPTSGLVECPTCGATVTLERQETVDTDGDGGESEGTGPDYFAGEETVEGVMDEIEQKEES
jgi:endogenous inhibitor of DNA gyrase (YacG/DUF329 family)